MTAWNGDKELKESVIDSIKQKIGNGQLMHGTYGEEHDGKMMGCAVFITTCNSDRPHEIFEEKYGIPAVLARYEDVIFEQLRAPHDEKWPVRFAEAIPVGADLSRVKSQFQCWLMQENLSHEKLWREHDKEDAYTSKVVAAIKKVAEILQKWADTGIIDESAAWSAWSAARSAWSAAESAESAAESAESDFYIRASEKLLELLAAAPVRVD